MRQGLRRGLARAAVVAPLTLAAVGLVAGPASAHDGYGNGNGISIIGDCNGDDGLDLDLDLDLDLSLDLDLL